MAEQQPTHTRNLGGMIRVAWFIVLTMMLAAAAWSISGKLTAWGMNPRLAWALSMMFDLAALICAEYARRAIERGTPAGLPRLAILGFVSVSGALNWSHGQEIGGTVAAYGLASISAAVELLFELHRRDVRDEQRAARGLVAERMPHIPVLGWLLFPSRAWATLRGAVGARLDLLDPVQTGHPTAQATTPQPGHDSRTVHAAIRAARTTMTVASPQDIVDHLADVGIDTDEDTVRTVLGVQSEQVVHPIHPSGQSVKDAVRTAYGCGMRDLPSVVRYVRGAADPTASESTIDRYLRALKKSA